MSPTFEPTTWLGLLAYLVISMAAVAVVAVPAWITVHRQRVIRADVAVVKDQVQNGHPRSAPPLRDQVDRGIEQNCELLQKIGYLTGKVEGVHDELKALHVRVARLEYPERRGRD